MFSQVPVIGMIFGALKKIYEKYKSMQGAKEWIQKLAQQAALSQDAQKKNVCCRSPGHGQFEFWV